jgi:hypothetical protein
MESSGLAACAIVPPPAFEIVYPVPVGFGKKQFAQLAMQGQDAGLKRPGRNLHFFVLPV